MHSVNCMMYVTFKSLSEYIQRCKIDVSFQSPVNVFSEVYDRCLLSLLNIFREVHDTCHFSVSLQYIQ